MLANACSNIGSFFDLRLEIRPSPIHGCGIFAKELIRSGEIIIVWGGRLYTVEQARDGKAKPDSLAGFDEGLYLGQDVEDPDESDKFLNHSCSPTVWMVGQSALCARLDIAIGEEVTADYALWEIDTDWRMQALCRCGTPECRHEITGLDWMRRDLQQKYAGHFLPCIERRIARLASYQRA